MCIALKRRLVLSDYVGTCVIYAMMAPYRRIMSESSYVSDGRNYIVDELLFRLPAL